MMAKYWDTTKILPRIMRMKMMPIITMTRKCCVLSRRCPTGAVLKHFVSYKTLNIGLFWIQIIIPKAFLGGRGEGNESTSRLFEGYEYDILQSCRLDALKVILFASQGDPMTLTFTETHLELILMSKRWYQKAKSLRLLLPSLIHLFWSWILLLLISWLDWILNNKKLFSFVFHQAKFFVPREGREIPQV